MSEGSAGYQTPARQAEDADEALARIRTEVQVAVADQAVGIQSILGYLCLREGGMLRPRFALAIADAFGTAPTMSLVRASAAVELLHTASLYHDDLIDDTDERRGAPAVHRRWGLAAAVVGGDLLVARALSLGAGCGPRVAFALLAAYEKLARGQLIEVAAPRVHRWSVPEYIALASGKAGALFQAAGRAGAIVSGVDDDTELACGRAGLHIGVAYQVLDDLADIASDIASGGVSLPLVLALERLPAPQAASLRRASLSSSALADAATAPEAIARAERLGRAHLRSARRWLDRAAVSSFARVGSYVDELEDRLERAANTAPAGRPLNGKNTPSLRN